MPEPRNRDITQILEQISGGDVDAPEQLFPLVYGQLKEMASRMFGSQRSDHTLQPTALVHEAYLKMALPQSDEGAEFKNRAHFFAIAATAMRQILINYARDKKALKRGGGQKGFRITLSELTDSENVKDLDVLDVHDELIALAQFDERQAKVAELRFFAGLTLAEVAEVLGVARRTVDLEWKLAKTWFLKRISKD